MACAPPPMQICLSFPNVFQNRRENMTNLVSKLKSVGKKGKKNANGNRNPKNFERFEVAPFRIHICAVDAYTQALGFSEAFVYFPTGGYDQFDARGSDRDNFLASLKSQGDVYCGLVVGSFDMRLALKVESVSGLVDVNIIDAPMKFHAYNAEFQAVVEDSFDKELIYSKQFCEKIDNFCLPDLLQTIFVYQRNFKDVNWTEDERGYFFLDKN